MPVMKNLIIGNNTYDIYDDEAFKFSGDAREGSCLYVGTSSPYTPNLQLKRNNASMLNLSVQDDGYLKLQNVPYVDGEDDWSNATTLWNVDMTKLQTWEPITLTRTNNSYVNATSFARLQAFRLGAIGILRFNLQLSSSMPTSTGATAIGSMSIHPSTEILQTIPCQSNNSTILLHVVTDGTIYIYNSSGTATGTNFFRANIPFTISM